MTAQFPLINLIRAMIKTGSFAACIVAPALAFGGVNFATLPLGMCQSGNGQATGSNYSADIVSNIATGNPLTNTNPYVFQTGFHGGSWSGYLRKFSVIVDSDGKTQRATQPEWDAAMVLTKSTDPLKRLILTFNPATKATIPFNFDNLSPELQAAFNKSPDSDAIDNLGMQRVRYLYGDRQMEQHKVPSAATPFRVRDNILGDIVNSNPVYVGGASENQYGTKYLAFYEQFKHRKGVVYVGANDGMLHAFSAETGSELFSYIPSPFLARLPDLSYASYQHRFYMDGKISVAEAQISGTWKTVLAAGMGRGARGVFALDVTRPDAFLSGDKVLFEFTEKDDADIGNILSPPAIVKINIQPNTTQSVNRADADDGRFFIMVPGGYNPANVSSDHFMFLIALDKAPGTPWIANKNYYKIKIGTDNPGATNVLSSPGLASDLRGAVKFAYAGDLLGNLWRFDFSMGASLETIRPTRVFTARDSSNNPQPITAEPLVIYAPGGGYLIQFGTGKYVENTDLDPGNFNINSFYAIRDAGATKNKNYVVKDRDELARRLLSAVPEPGTVAYKITGNDFIFGDTSSDKIKKGWYVDFPHSNLTGERSISTALLAYGNVYFNTFTPGRACNGPDTSNSYAFNVLTGKISDSAATTGHQSLNTVATPLLLRSFIQSGERDAFGQYKTTQYYSVLNFEHDKKTDPTINPNPDGADFKVELKAGRLSWREIQNWQDLK